MTDAERQNARALRARPTVDLGDQAVDAEGAPLMTVPPNILAALPKLPEDLEFRFVNRHMILLDVHANLIVDYVLNAVQ